MVHLGQLRVWSMGLAPLQPGDNPAAESLLVEMNHTPKCMRAEEHLRGQEQLRNLLLLRFSGQAQATAPQPALAEDTKNEAAELCNCASAAPKVTRRPDVLDFLPFHGEGRRKESLKVKLGS